MGFLLLVVAIFLFLAGLCSAVGAVRLLRLLKKGTPKKRRRLWVLLALGILGGGYLSVGLVYASAKTRWYGAPMPMVIFQPMGKTWVDFVSPLSLLAPFYNFILWVGLACAPVTLPRWWRRSGRAWVAQLTTAPTSRKARWLAAGALCLTMPPLLGYLLTTRHVVTVRNQSAISLQELALSDGRTNRYQGSFPPNEERVFDFEQSMPESYIFVRREGKGRIELGRCEHTNGRLNRYVVTISGEQAEHLECVEQTP